MWVTTNFLSVIVLWALSCFRIATAKGIYSVVASKVLRPNMDYDVAVSAHNTNSPLTVTLEIIGNLDSGGTFLNRKQTTVEPENTQIVKFQLGPLGHGEYNLTVAGSGSGLVIKNTTQLQYVHKSYSTFIQTDKAIYMPGQRVQFRVILVNPYLKPSVTGAVDIYITDGGGNRVKQWSRVFFTKGVYSGDLLLSDQPVLGDWNITVTVLKQTFHKQFTVAEYVLPKFEVSLSVPTYALMSDTDTIATVSATYTYGKPVKGKAVFTVSPVFKSSYIQPFYTHPVRKTVDINGKATVSLNLIKELQLTDDYERQIQWDVTVIEDLTGRKENSTEVMSLHKYRYKLELIKTAENFKPGLRYTAFLKVSYQDGTPVQDGENQVSIQYGYTYDREKYTVKNYWIGEGGKILLDFFPPASEDVVILNIAAEYREVFEYFASVQKAQSPSQVFIQATLQTPTPRVNHDVVILVNSTEPLQTITYEVVGRGDVVIGQTLQVYGRSTHEFRFLVTPNMAPHARLLVYFLYNGEVVADALDFDVEGTFQNEVNIEARPSETEPGKRVDITITTKGQSFVGILGVDQSVLLLKGGNDITQNDVLQELESYDPIIEDDMDVPIPFLRGRSRRSYWWPGSSTAAEVFEDSGLIIMTNGWVYENSPYGNSHLSTTVRTVDAELPGVSTLVADKGPALLYPSPTRPPLHGPFAFSRVPRPVDTRPRVHVRRILPGAWLFANATAGTNGRAVIRNYAPDTITSWTISAFSIHSIYGLGIASNPAKLTVFRKFFVSLNLPYSVIRGEVIAVQATVFNYMNKPLEVSVTLKNNNQDYDFYEGDNSIEQNISYMSKTANVKAQDGALVSFFIRPKKLGLIPIEITARAVGLPGTNDAIQKELRVKPEGVTQQKNKPFLVDLRQSSSFQEVVNVAFPNGVIPDSQRVEVSAVGDLLGPSLNNLDQLLEMPYGCGEQNMINFVPNIVVTKYLEARGLITPTIKNKAIRFMEAGYQRELTYKRDDNSFSAFGNKDESGSTWLTAFVVRSFQAATEYITIDREVILKALRWLISKQDKTTGKFPEVGSVSHQDMQGGASGGVPLTAYTLIAFFENEDNSMRAFRSEYRNNINHALDFLAKEVDKVNDPYTLSLMAYAFQLAQHNNKEQVFRKFHSYAIGHGEWKYWSREEPIGHNLDNTKSLDIEMTSYGLLTYVARGEIAQAMPSFKWLITQRNRQGGFISTQDTVVGIQALATLATALGSRTVNLDVTFNYGSGVKKAKIDNENLILMQKFELPADTSEVTIEASGQGVGLVQVSWSYNIEVSAPNPAFSLDPQISRASTKNYLRLSICTGYKYEGDTNMAVMDVSFPSGYTADRDAILSVYRYDSNIKRVDGRDGNTGIVIYFDKLNNTKEVCPTVQAHRTYPVADQKPAPVVVYDYYDKSREARHFYSALTADVCQICEGQDCEKYNCKGLPGYNERTSYAAETVIVSHGLLLLCALAMSVL